VDAVFMTYVSLIGLESQQQKFCLNIGPDIAVVIVKANVVLHNFVLGTDGYKFEDALIGTGLENVPEGQSVLGGLTANNIRNKVADYFVTDAGAASWHIKSMNNRVHEVKKKKHDV